jgi:hypothetical protein
LRLAVKAAPQPSVVVNEGEAQQHLGRRQLHAQLELRNIPHALTRVGELLCKGQLRLDALPQSDAELGI